MENYYFKSLNLNEVIIADLHIHSKYSRACSKDLDIPNLVKWARIKGINLLGTGDFTHPKWLNDNIKANLKEKKGIYYYEDSKKSSESNEFEKKGKFPFILSSEISLIYTQDGKGRKVHLVFLAPSIEVVDKINSYLDSKGRRDYDGRPIFGISCRDFVFKMREIDSRIEVIPAHIWTPYFGVFGSKGGFNSLKEAFLDQVDFIHAIETGISSDPSMNWKIKDLENKAIISFSDAHSFWPWRLGREATIFRNEKNIELSYNEIIRQIRENQFLGTIETDPCYGKYHFDGHSGCEFSCSYEETKKLNGQCPKCKKPLIIGVEYRVNELSLKYEGQYKEKFSKLQKIAKFSVESFENSLISSDLANYSNFSKNKKKYFKVLPLHEIISLVKGYGVSSKGCNIIYEMLIENFNNEFNILFNVSYIELLNVSKNKMLAELIILNREGKIFVKPGYDGVYGKAIISDE